VLSLIVENLERKIAALALAELILCRHDDMV
jgi:hypothetical protein